MLNSLLLSAFSSPEKQEKRQRKESKLIQQLEKQKQKKEEGNEQQVQQEQKESKGEQHCRDHSFGIFIYFHAVSVLDCVHPSIIY